MAFSLHIGLNKVDKKAYPYQVPDLMACEKDAIDLQKLAIKIGYKSSLLLGENANYNALVQAIASMASQLKAGDIFLLTYSGHGSQVLDKNGDETDGLDETWVLYDRQIIDDELYELWSKFALGVRILVISDSCHSGTVVRTTQAKVRNTRDKVIPFCAASGILLSASRDHQTAMEIEENGLFTSKLLEAWNDGKFRGNYRQFRNAIASQLPRSQSPNYYTFGRRNTKFYGQLPFTI